MLFYCFYVDIAFTVVWRSCVAREDVVCGVLQTCLYNITTVAATALSGGPPKTRVRRHIRDRQTLFFLYVLYVLHGEEHASRVAGSILLYREFIGVHTS